jgi:hypothetical protein
VLYHKCRSIISYILLFPEEDEVNPEAEFIYLDEVDREDEFLRPKKDELKYPGK